MELLFPMMENELLIERSNSSRFFAITIFNSAPKEQGFFENFTYFQITSRYLIPCIHIYTACVC